ncbi:hypothetical protein [Rahnella bonaserana]|uniref:hypothetical protein n=1 Tax=Rahnella bonaserana TaxID=2816248 RepID=UPI0032089758
MNNNVKLLSSISLESDFENLIKQYAAQLFEGNAYLIGGPWDNGKDLVIKQRGREVHQAAQISIQENRIEDKVNSDLQKVVKLVDEHNYPPVLYFFWSHPISEYTLDKIRTKALKEHFINLEFYDAKRIAQDLTDNYPNLLNHVIKDIHKFDFTNENPVNIKQRAFYEYLLLSKDSTNLKNAIIDANIMSSLYDGARPLTEILDNLKGVNLKIRSLKNRLVNLCHQGKIEITDDLYSLSNAENIKLENIRLREVARKNELLTIIGGELSKHTSKNLALQVVDLIVMAYEESLSIQITESKFEPPKLQIFKTTVHNLKILIKNECELDDSHSDALAKDLMTLAGQNDYLSEHCSAKLCVNLLSDSKLEKYIEDKNFYIYLDAPVLIPYLITIIFDNTKLFDKSIKNINLMREYINSLKNKRLRVTNEHFEETARHFFQAEKLSQFVTEELIEQLGESKNVYFNVYIRWKKNQPPKVSFDDFTYAFLGLDKDEVYSSNKFDNFANCIHSLLTSANFDIINNKNSVPDDFIERIRKKFTREIHSFRPSRAVENDVICAATLSDDKLHLDNQGYFSAPMLITLDTSQYLMRTIIRKENKHAEWLIYTPQRAIERLSLVGLKISSESLKDGVLATISDEYFFKENSASLIDTLSIIIGDNEASEGDVIKLVTYLKRKVNEESIDYKEIDIEHYNNISYVLLFIHREFKDDFSRVLKLFTETNHHNELIELLLVTIKGTFNEEQKDSFRNKMNSLLNKIS